jgi:hypothetical protein
MVLEYPPLGGDRPGLSRGRADHDDPSRCVPGGWDLVHRDWGLRHGERGMRRARGLAAWLAARVAALVRAMARVWWRAARVRRWRAARVGGGAAISPPGGAGSGTRRSSAPRA